MSLLLIGLLLFGLWYLWSKSKRNRKINEALDRNERRTEDKALHDFLWNEEQKRNAEENQIGLKEKQDGPFQE